MFKRIILALIVLFLLGGYFVWSSRREEKKKHIEEETRKIVKLDFKKLKKIILKRPNSTVIFKKKENLWWITFPLEDYADRYSVSNILDAFRDRKYERKLTKVSDLSIYGLSKPEYSVTFETSDGKEVTLQIGRRLPTSAKVFVKYPESNNVYLVRTGFLYSLREKISGYRDKKVFKIFYSAPVSGLNMIVKIKVVQKGGENYILASHLKSPKEPEEVKKAGLPEQKLLTWVVHDSVNDDADDGEVGSLVRKIKNLSIINFVKNHPSPRDLARYGLYDPEKKLTIYLDTMKQVTLSVGNHLPKPRNEYYAMISGYPTIFTIKDYNVKDLFPDIQKVRSRKLPQFFADQITGIVIGKFGRELHLHRTKDWKWADRKGHTYDPNNLYQFVSGLNGQYGSELLDSYDDKIDRGVIGKIIFYNKKGKKVLDIRIHQPLKIGDRGKVLWLELVSRKVFLSKHTTMSNLIPDKLFKTEKELEKKEKGEENEQNK